VHRDVSDVADDDGDLAVVLGELAVGRVVGLLEPAQVADVDEGDRVVQLRVDVPAEAVNVGEELAHVARGEAQRGGAALAVDLVDQAGERDELLVTVALADSHHRGLAEQAVPLVARDALPEAVERGRALGR
jgi:hypothetical protein